VGHPRAITHSISDPVRAWLDAHTAAMPATAGQLWTLWLVAVGALFVAALAGWRSAHRDNKAAHSC
jgi:hypothetical protein